MKSSRLLHGLIITGALMTPCGAQTQSDPYNPQTRRTPPVGNAASPPSLEDLGFGSDQGNIGPFVTMTDKQYAQAMAARGIMEIQLGQAALEKSSRTEVKIVARRMIDDYLKWNDGMSKAAAKLAIPLPSTLNSAQKADVDRVCALSGDAFDRAYLKRVIHLQQRALTMSHHEASNAAVSGFRHWAGVVVPTLQDQISSAQTALNKLGRPPQ